MLAGRALGVGDCMAAVACCLAGQFPRSQEGGGCSQLFTVPETKAISGCSSRRHKHPKKAAKGVCEMC